MPPQKFTVGLVQMSTTSDPDKNLQHAIDKVHQAAARGAQIVCLPELFQTQYFCQREDAALFDLAEPIPGPVTNRLAALAKQLRIVLIASLFEKRAPGVYHNTAAIFDADGSLRGLYRKMHIPDDPLYYEKFYFTPGDLGYPRLRYHRRPRGHAGLLGPVVSRRRAPDRAAGRPDPVLSHGHRLASGGESEFGQSQHDAWRTIQRAHAIANGVYVAVVNRVGHETGNIRGNAVAGAGLEFWGGIVPLRSLRPGDRRSLARQRRNSDRRSRPARRWKTSAATGLSCATAASTATRRSPSSD